MNWIKVTENLPTEYNKYYLVLAKTNCELCDKNEGHPHKLNYVRYRYDVAKWAEKDMYLVNYYRTKGDNSWDHWAVDHFVESGLPHEVITHWMEFPQEPK